MFDTLQDRLASTFKGLRGKGRLTDADIDATTRQIRIALLEADVNLSVVKEFVAAIKERCHGEELSKALNPTQQIVKIVNEELVEILGGQTRTVRFAKTPDDRHACRLARCWQDDPGWEVGSVVQGRGPLPVVGRLRPPAAQCRHSVAGGRRTCRGARLRS